ncbi:hypothetical protein M7I_2525 [Glarea lozoyensis 74030]|uniref:Uncharacterized protein n=1 Tax=Glarea lozoyensis (strain ATCC 74030 / MF5533) TaxID=1104152 RepID=H0EJ03_GLAL7|nr:hypothetical protein M7I_2525 [Glarea lozoyensis 74030]
MQIIPRQQDQYEVSEMIAAIERSHHAWGNTNEASAKKARNVSKAMLTKIRAARAAQSGKHQAKVKHGYNQTDQGVEALSLGDIVGHDNSIITDHELDQWMNIDNYDETSQSSGDGLLMNKNPMPLSAPFNTFIDVPGNIDWTFCCMRWEGRKSSPGK